MTPLNDLVREGAERLPGTEPHAFANKVRE
jgi:hypothetical protein